MGRLLVATGELTDFSVAFVTILMRFWVTNSIPLCDLKYIYFDTVIQDSFEHFPVNLTFHKRRFGIF